LLRPPRPFTWPSGSASASSLDCPSASRSSCSSSSSLTPRPGCSSRADRAPDSLFPRFPEHPKPVLVRDLAERGLVVAGGGEGVDQLGEAGGVADLARHGAAIEVGADADPV